MAASGTVERSVAYAAAALVVFVGTLMALPEPAAPEAPDDAVPE